MSLTKDLIGVVQGVQDSKTKPYDPQATVTRVDGDTVWVHFTGGVDETPVAKTINAKEGDVVRVRVSNGSAFLLGNGTAPPTDDTTANVAQDTATQANTTAVKAEETAGIAEDIARDAAAAARGTSQYFWHTETDTGAGAGAHVTEIPQEDFLDDPQNGGGNVLLTSSGMDVRDGTDVLATFGANGARIGKTDVAYLSVDNDSIEFFNGSDMLGYVASTKAQFPIMEVLSSLAINGYVFRQTPTGALGLYLK